MSDAKSAGMMSELIKHAFTTAIGVVVTFYVTSAVKEDDFEQDEIKKGKQVMESLEKTNVMLSNYISRYDSLHEKYIQLRETKGRNIYKEDAEAYKSVNYKKSSQQKNTASFINDSDWITPDGSVLWKFSHDKVSMLGIGSFEGFMEAAGNYTVSGENLQGSAIYSKLLYLPSNENVKFSFKLDAEGKVLYGNITDNIGNVTVATLYKKN